MSHRIQTRNRKPGPFSLEAPALPSELPCFGMYYYYLHVKFIFQVLKMVETSLVVMAVCGAVFILGANQALHKVPTVSMLTPHYSLGGVNK